MGIVIVLSAAKQLVRSLKQVRCVSYVDEAAQFVIVEHVQDFNLDYALFIVTFCVVAFRRNILFSSVYFEKAYCSARSR